MVATVADPRVALTFGAPSLPVQCPTLHHHPLHWLLEDVACCECVHSRYGGVWMLVKEPTRYRLYLVPFKSNMLAVRLARRLMEVLR